MPSQSWQLYQGGSMVVELQYMKLMQVVGKLPLLFSTLSYHGIRLSASPGLCYAHHVCVYFFISHLRTKASTRCPDWNPDISKKQGNNVACTTESKLSIQQKGKEKERKKEKEKRKKGRRGRSNNSCWLLLWMATVFLFCFVFNVYCIVNLRQKQFLCHIHNSHYPYFS